jgi:hypothetical protein
MVADRGDCLVDVREGGELGGGRAPTTDDPEREGGSPPPSRTQVRSASRYPRPTAVPLNGNVVSWVCGLRWPSFLAPATARSLRFQIRRPRVMSDS